MRRQRDANQRLRSGRTGKKSYSERIFYLLTNTKCPSIWSLVSLERIYFREYCNLLDSLIVSAISWTLLWVERERVEYILVLTASGSKDKGEILGIV